MSFIWSTYRNIGEGYLTGEKELKDSSFVKAQTSMSGSSQSWEPGVYCAATDSSTGWRITCPSQVVQLFWDSSRQLV